MRQLIPQLLGTLAADQAVVYCRLVETRGSTPQKAGAAMLVYADGSQSGTLGGGCVEAEVKRRALATLQSHQAEIVTLQLDSDYGWDDGLICGGRMTALVDPLLPHDDITYYRTLGQRLASGEGVLEAVVFDSEKCELAAPACYLFDEEGNVAASRLNAAAEGLPQSVLASMPVLLDRPRPSAAGGVAWLPLLPRCRLLIVGGGHVGQAVAKLGSEVDFDVWVVDDRIEYVSPERFPTAQRLISGTMGPTLRELEITPSTYCVIVTRGHNHDEEALHHLVDRGARYVGMIGSRRKIKLIFDDLEAEGVSPEALSRVFAPLGIDIGSQTVVEIAVSIVAELISHRNQSGHVPGRPASIMAEQSP